MNNSNYKYINKLEKRISKNTNLKRIKYLNEYDNYYIVMDDNYLYLYDNKYTELLRIDRILIHENNDNYDIIYKDKQIMYLNDYYKNGKLYYEYYDLYSYKLIDDIVLGEYA